MYRETSMEELWSTAENLLGPVHCLVNNAGVIIVIMTMMMMMIVTMTIIYEDDLFR